MTKELVLRNTPEMFMNPIIRSIGDWAEEEFGKVHSQYHKDRLILRTLDEVKELQDELVFYEELLSTENPDRTQLEEQLKKVRAELADVFIAAGAALYQLEIDILDDVLGKQEVNESRRWIPNPERPGTGRHVKSVNDLVHWCKLKGCMDKFEELKKEYK